MTIRLQITTPGGAVVDTDVDELAAPGILGELGVLPGHVPLVTALRPGVLTFRASGRGGTLAVGEGFLEVSPAAGGAAGGGDRVIVLVDRATQAAEVDRADAEREVADLDRQIAQWKRDLDGEYRALLDGRAWAQARVDAAARSAAH